ncbi:hypothetical protein BDC45DRAFT_536812 [Circinella umbellata]|nr:hypothetical protein BDC45DRAFT_536812 [Circinella umbellata]
MKESYIVIDLAVVVYNDSQGRVERKYSVATDSGFIIIAGAGIFAKNEFYNEKEYFHNRQLQETIGMESKEKQKKIIILGLLEHKKSKTKEMLWNLRIEGDDDILLHSPPPKYASSATSSTAYVFPSAPSQREQEHQSKLNIQDMGQTALLPILNVMATVILVSVLIYVYTSADNKPVDYRMAGMPIEALISLLQTLIKMLLAGGIGYALSEFKWIKLESGTQLSQLDVYDAVTRGFGGIIRIVTGIRPDSIIIPAILLQLGLIAIGPSSQQVLSAHALSYCDNSVQFRFTDVTNEMFASWKQSDKDIRSLSGITANYLVEMAIDGVGQEYNFPLNTNCPPDAKNCTIVGMPTLINKVECTPGIFNQTTIISEQDRSVMTVQQYYNFTDGFDYMTRPRTPRFFYAGSMQHRTGYDISNFSLPEESKAISTEPITPDNTTTASTAYAGDQVFVIVSSNGTANVNTIEYADEIVVHECKLVPYLNRTDFAIMGHDAELTYHDSTPIEMNYELLSDKSHWNRSDNEDDYSSEDKIILNAYAIQVAALNYIITQDQSEFNDRNTASWAIRKDRDGKNTIEYFIYILILRISQAVTLGRPVSLSPVDGVACFDLPTRYHLDPASYYTFCLCLLIPVFWWVLAWVIALYRAGGVSRGNSQVLLLVTGFTAALRKQFKGLSHADANTIFTRAKKANVKFGELTTEHARKRGHVSFGTPEQISSLYKPSVMKRSTSPSRNNDSNRDEES